MSNLRAEDCKKLIDESPMMSFLGIKLEGFDTEEMTARFSLPTRSEFERVKKTGQYHGGAILAFADTAGDFAVAHLVGGLVPTVNFRMDFLRPAAGAGLTAVARVRKLGRTVAVVDVDLFDERSRLVAIGRGTYGASAG